MSGRVGKFGELVELVPEVVNMLDSEDGNTLLHWAAACNEVECARILIELGAKQKLNHRKKTPFDIAQDAYKRPDASFFNIMRLIQPVPNAQ